MFGREREQAGILTEPSKDSTFDLKDAAALEAFRDRIQYVVSLYMLRRR